ncbi:hypothetical protein ACFL0P_07190 [Candidatus Omnitrophota bacterium]
MADEDNNTGKPENQDKGMKPSTSSSIDVDQIKHLEGYLEEVKNTRGRLEAGEIGAEEAKKRLRDITEIFAAGMAKQEVRKNRQIREVEETTRMDVKQEFDVTKQVQGIESTELFEGELDLILVSPVDLGQLRELQKHLCQVPDLRLVLLSGSADKGTTIVVSAEKPIPLIDILREMPPVNQVNNIGSEIQIMLKAE